jgi:hypothetical protein
MTLMLIITSNYRDDNYRLIMIMCIYTFIYKIMYNNNDSMMIKTVA